MTGIWMLASLVCAGASCGFYVKARRAARVMMKSVQEGAQDAPLAAWCRHMHLTVITVTGTEFTTSLAELQAGEVSTARTWNVPVSVTLWSDLDVVPAVEPLGKPRG